VTDLLAYYPPWFLEQGAALLPILPLLVGAILAILPTNAAGRSLSWWGALAVAVVLIYTSLGQMLLVYTEGPYQYFMGDWEPPRGISLDVDALNTPIALLVSIMAFVALLYARASVIAEVEPKKHGPFYGAFLFVVAGLLGMLLSGDAFNIFVFVEISSISTYVLVAMGSSRDRRALPAAFNYLILGSIGATFYVIGVGFLFAETGTLNMKEMAFLLSQLDGGSRVAQVGFAFVVIGLGLKLAMFPLHTWLPAAYAHAPSFVTIFLASTATKVALYLLIRFIFTVFDPSLAYVSTIVTYGITALAVAAMLFSSTQAIFQTDARRVLAYSSVAQVGYILLGIGLGTVAGLSAGYLHLINHAVIKGGLFVCLGAFWYHYGITRTADFAGLGKMMPWTMGAFTICALSLIGVPLTAGFISKLNLASAAADQGWWWAVAVIMISSILAIIYMGRIILTAYFQPPPAAAHGMTHREATPLMSIAMFTLATISVVIGIVPEGVVEVADRAARTVLPLGGL